MPTSQTIISRSSGRRSQRQMELIASVSRSSGMEKGGDALKSHNIQEQYRAFVQDKV